MWTRFAVVVLTLFLIISNNRCSLFRVWYSEGFPLKNSENVSVPKNSSTIGGCSFREVSLYYSYFKTDNENSTDVTIGFCFSDLFGSQMLFEIELYL